MASAAFKPRLRFTGWCPVYVRSCWAVHLGPAVPREVLHMNTQHWQLYVTQTAQRAAMTKLGSCAFPPHSSGLLHEHRSTPGRPSTTSPYGRHTSCALHQDPTYTETVFLSLPLFTCCALRLHSEIIIFLRAGLIPLCQMLLSGSAGFRSATRLQLFGT